MVAVVVLAFLAGLGSSTVLLRGSSASGSTSNPSVSTQCTVAAEGEVLLQILNSTSGEPIPNAPVQAQVTPFYCNSTPPTTISLNTTLTNSTGYAEFGSELGEYHLTLYSYGNYFADASTLPEKTTCVTLGIPSGDTSITYSGFLESSCQFGLPPHHQAST